MKVFLALSLFALVGAAYAGGHAHDYYDYYSYPKYQYNYGVADKLTGDRKSAGETRDGEWTKGYYQLLQPDGVIRLVKYTSGPKVGFQAEVINKGKAAHPGHYHGYGHHGGHGGHQGGHGGFQGAYGGY